MTSRTLTLAAALVVVALVGAHPAGAQEPQMPIPPGEAGPPVAGQPVGQPLGQPTGQPYCAGCDAGGYDITYGCAGGCDGGCGGECYGGGCYGGGGCGGGGCGAGCGDCGGCGHSSFSLFGGHGGCGDCCYDDDCLIAYTRFDVLYWRRDRPRNVQITSEGEGGPIVLETDDLPNSDWEAMPRFSIGVPISHCTLIEGVYFGTPTWQSEASVTDPNGNLFSVYTDFGTNGLDPSVFGPSTLQFIQYQSMLHNVEGNILYLLPDCSCRTQTMLLAGFRYVNIREIFRYETQNSDIPAGQLNTIQTYNSLLAWQLGARIDTQLHGRLHMLLEGKAGLAVNLASQQTEFLGTGLAAGDQANFSARNDHLALVTYAGATLVYDVCPWMSLRGGYHVMYVNGVALAPENLAAPLPLNFPNDVVAEINDHGAILYHGATAGLEIRW
jgi:hypothetical protein